MYCTNCGNKCNGGNFCTRCGNKLEELKVDNTTMNKGVNNKVVVKEENSGLKTASIVLGILGIVGSLMIVFFPVSFILSLIGLILGIVATKKVKNVVGIILNSVGLFLSIIICIACVWFLICIGSGIKTGSDFYDEYYNDDYNWNYDDYFDDSESYESFNDIMGTY